MTLELKGKSTKKGATEMLENCRIFELYHPDADCKGDLTNIKFCLMPDFSLIILGDCSKCGGKDIGLKYSLRTLFRWAKELRKQPKPLIPPLAIVPPKFTEADIIELHALGVRLDL